MKNKSFTLIELLVVIVIIGILAGVITMTTTSYIEQANLTKAQSFSSNVSNRLWKNLISEWTFDLPAVSGITEDTGSSNDGTVIGEAMYIPRSSDECVYGGCYSFNGDSYIDCGNASNLDIIQKITVTTWINFSNYLNTALIVNKYQGAYSGTWHISTGSLNIKKLRYVFTDENMVYRYGESSKDIPINEWVFIGWSFDSGVVKLYINGEEENFGNYNVNMASNTTSTLKIGGRPSSTYFNGLIDDVRIYDKALSLSEIKQEYVAGLDSLYSKGLISKEEYNNKIDSLAFKGS